MGSVKTVRVSSVPEAFLPHPLEGPSKLFSRRSSLLSASSDENELINLFSKVRCGMSSHAPELANEGAGTVYYLKDGSGENAAVFKPYDEEAIPFIGADKDGIQLGDEIKPGIIYGEGYLKEVAAFLLDGYRFHDVPPTTVFILSHRDFAVDGHLIGRKVGSLQKYIDHKCSAEDIGWNMFPVREVHRLGILDLRILNNDRHLGNILVAEGNDGFYRLIPIDHAETLPSALSGGYFEWLSFPQARQPFDSETLSYIEHLNPERDAKVLEHSLPSLRKECLVTLKFCTYFLKMGARCKLTLYQLGCLMSRYLDNDEPCELEKLKRVVDAQASGMDDVENSPEYWRIAQEEIAAFFARWNSALDLHRV